MAKAGFDLTKRSVEALKPGLKDVFYWDASLRGFGLKVTPAGRRVYVFQYRVAGKSAQRISLGEHGPITADTARKEAQRLRGIVAQGRDPIGEKREAERETARLELERRRAAEALIEQSVSNRAKVWLEHIKAKKPRTYGFYEGIMRNHVVPVIGDVAMPEMKYSDVWRVIDHIPVKQETLRRNVKATVSAFWHWCNSRHFKLFDAPLSEISPFPKLSKADEESEKIKPRDRVLNDAEINTLWHASAQLIAPFRGFVRLLLLTGQRRSEVAGLDWSELDREAELWILSRERSKNGEANKVALSPLALREIDRLAGGADWPLKGPVLTTNGMRSIGGFSYIKRKIDYEIATLNGHPFANWHIHDLRRTVATKLQRMGIRFEVIEAILNHRVKLSGSAAPYQTHDWAPEKASALAALAKEIECIVEGKEAKNVVPIKRDLAR